MAFPETFEGFGVVDQDPAKWSTVEKVEFKPKPFGDHDVDIKIHCCGICASDCHTLIGSAGWGGRPKFPAIVGHEIVGKVVRVGDKVTTLKVGDTAGLGAVSWACLECDICKDDNETYCPKWVDTYNDLYPDGSRSYGGYSSHARVHEHFAFPIPENLSPEGVAPMLCAGITVYSPLVRNNIGPGTRVGIVGIGGLGHFAIMFAKALGAEVYAISRSDRKKEDALKLGAHHFVATENKGWNEPLKYKFDLILCCANSTDNFDLPSYLSLLKIHKKFISVGLPEDSFTLNAMSLLKNGSFFGSSHLGSRKETLAMLKLASENNIESWYQSIPISSEGVHEALEGCHAGKPRYRYVLTDYEKQWK